MLKITSRIMCTVAVGLTLVLTALAEFEAPGQHIRSRNALDIEEILDSQGAYLEYTRGVLMQALASFRGNDGKPVASSGVSVSVLESESGSARVPCLRIGPSSCGKILLSVAEVRAIARFVANGRYRAFTLPSDGPDVDRIIAAIREDMVPVADSYPKKDWIARELAAADFARIFRFIDYDDPFSFTSRIVGRIFAEPARREMNAKVGHFVIPKTKIVDDTYFNTDLHANLVARVSGNAMICDGLPTRYHWELHAGYRFAYVREIEFALPDFKNPEYMRFLNKRMPLFNVEHMRSSIEAQSVFCTTAILRTLQKEHPSALVDFLK
jgi:hypothetical protein